MASDDKNATRTALVSEHDTEEASEERTTYLQHGRQVAVTRAGSEDIVEIRGSGGALELRVRVTEEGPVMSLEGVKLELKSAESVAVECKTFEVKATDGVELATEGELRMSSEKEMSVESTSDIRINGKTIWLN